MVETVVLVDSFPIVLWDIADGGVLLRKGLPAQLSAWCQQGGFMEDGEVFHHVQTTVRCREWDRKRGRGWPTALQKQGTTTWGLARAAGMACTQDGRGFQTPTQETAPFWTLTQMVDFHQRCEVTASDWVHCGGSIQTAALNNWYNLQIYYTGLIYQDLQIRSCFQCITYPHTMAFVCGATWQTLETIKNIQTELKRYKDYLYIFSTSNGKITSIIVTAHVVLQTNSSFWMCHFG